ncbi:MAG TPA: OmpA family protein [Verrucomicrobiota bacterium]|nr:OmpA family protein [Verrucomicrobiota bacterium]
MPRSTWIFAGALSIAVLLALGALQLRVNSQARVRAEAAAAEARADLSQLAALTNQWAADLLASQTRVVELEQAIQQAAQTQAGLEQQMRADLESRDITISELQGKLTVNILDHVLFDSGEARLKAGGETVLRKVAQVLGRYPNRAIQIIGHTDNVPIRSRTPEGFTDNWALSAGRAVAAVRFLVEQAGVDPQRVNAVGCGEFRPLTSNATAEGRAKNRRIAVVVLPEEFARPDAPPPASKAAEVPGAPVPPVVAPTP